jgi:hypothetical protein
VDLAETRGLVSVSWVEGELRRATTDVDRAYGLGPALDPGRTCPEIRHVIGSTEPHDWQERLDAERGWVCA